MSPGDACAIGYSSVDKWLPGAGGVPIPPGLPAMVVVICFFFFFITRLLAGVSVDSSDESSELDEMV